jgi:hypothetical protein
LGGMLFAFILIKYWQKDKSKFYWTIPAKFDLPFYY